MLTTQNIPEDILNIYNKTCAFNKSVSDTLIRDRCHIYEVMHTMYEHNLCILNVLRKQHTFNSNLRDLIWDIQTSQLSIIQRFYFFKHDVCYFKDKLMDSFIEVTMLNQGGVIHKTKIMSGHLECSCHGPIRIPDNHLKYEPAYCDCGSLNECNISQKMVCPDDPARVCEIACKPPKPSCPPVKPHKSCECKSHHHEPPHLQKHHCSTCKSPVAPKHHCSKCKPTNFPKI